MALFNDCRAALKLSEFTYLSCRRGRDGFNRPGGLGSGKGMGHGRGGHAGVEGRRRGERREGIGVGRTWVRVYVRISVLHGAMANLASGGWGLCLFQVQTVVVKL